MAKREKTPEPDKMTVVSVKMTIPFRDWITSLADFDRLSQVQLIEKALVEYAEKRKFPQPPPRRTRR